VQSLGRIADSAIGFVGAVVVAVAVVDGGTVGLQVVYYCTGLRISLYLCLHCFFIVLVVLDRMKRNNHLS